MDLLDLVTDPEPVDCETHPGAMIRVVEVVDALESLWCPDGCEGRLAFRSSDDTFGWNDGLFDYGREQTG